MHPTGSVSPIHTTARRAVFLRQLHQWHWISSALCLMAMLLFAVTGFTLNHASQIEAEPVVTSGDYRQYFQQGPRRVSHTLDPRTGWPIANDVASVTVLAPTCMAADALSTVLTVLGPVDGLAFAERRALAARFLVRGAGALAEVVSPAWKALLQ